MRAVPFAQIRLGARAVATRLGLASRLRARSLPDLLSALGAHGVEAAPLAVVEQALAASQRVVARLRVVPDTCLYRALARYALLRRAGHPARFVMALDPREGDIVGHAWVELHGEPVGEAIEPGLTVTFSYPQGRA